MVSGHESQGYLAEGECINYLGEVRDLELFLTDSGLDCVMYRLFYVSLRSCFKTAQNKRYITYPALSISRELAGNWERSRYDFRSREPVPGTIFAAGNAPNALREQSRSLEHDLIAQKNQKKKCHGRRHTTKK
jgi:hypothetical protein